MDQGSLTDRSNISVLVSCEAAGQQERAGMSMPQYCNHVLSLSCREPAQHFDSTGYPAALPVAILGPTGPQGRYASHSSCTASLSDLLGLSRLRAVCL